MLHPYISTRHLVTSVFSCSNCFIHNVDKGKGDDQANWRVLQNEKLARLKEKLRRSNEQVTQGLKPLYTI